MKKWIASCTFALLVAGIPAATAPSLNIAQAAAPLKLIIDGEAALSALNPFYADSILYIPVRILTEYYPARLHWDNQLKQLTVADDSSTTLFRPGSAFMMYSGSSFELEGKVLLRQGHVYLPASAFNSLSGAEVEPDPAANSIGIESGSVSTTVRVPAVPLTAAENNSKVKLYAALKNGDTYEGFILEVEGRKHTFSWKAPRDLSHPPELYYADIDKDGKREAVVILTLGTGTGIVAQEIHAVKPEQWKEIAVPEAYEAAEALVSSSISTAKEDMLVTIQLKGASPSTVTLRLPGRAEEVELGTQAGIGAVTYYRVEDDKLIAETSVSIGFAEGIGRLKLVYKPAGEGMGPESVTFLPFEEYPVTVKKLVHP